MRNERICEQTGDIPKPVGYCREVEARSPGALRCRYDRRCIFARQPATENSRCHQCLAATASSCEAFHSLITTETPGNLKSLTNNPRRLFKNESSLSEKLNLNQARYDEILLHELVRFGGKMFHEESRRLAKLGFASITFILRCARANYSVTRY